MTLKPCAICGEPSEANRCDAHRRPNKSPAKLGYDWAWIQLSKRARRLQPFCTDCGRTDNLEADHTPEAWSRKAAGLTIRLEDIEVVCGPCNRARGAARTLAGGPVERRASTPGKAEFPLHTLRGLR